MSATDDPLAEYGPPLGIPHTFTDDEIAVCMAQQGVDDYFGDFEEDPLEQHPAYSDFCEASARLARGDVDEALVWLERGLNQLDGLHFGGLDTRLRNHFAAAQRSAP